jgi:glutathione S-transferase
MVTRKLKHFEIAGYVDGGSQGQLQYCQQDGFETPSGYALVLAGCGDDANGQNLPALAIDRVKYFLDNEEVSDPMDAVQHALLYANGFLFEQQRKEGKKATPVDCLLLLVHQQKVYYAWVGNMCMYLFTGKKWIPLAGEPAQDGSRVVHPLGVEKLIEPAICEMPLEPLDDDTLLAGTAAVCSYLRERDARKVLQDSMPAQTKVLRLVKLMGQQGNQNPVAMQLLSFYNIDRQERSFAAVDVAAPQAEAVLPRVKALFQDNGRTNMLKVAALALAALLIGYMVYDLFLYNPKPATRVRPVVEPAAVPADTVAAEAQTAAAVFPQDVSYTVRSGDTWGRIYGQFEVCSWFIRNHPPNAGRFDNAGNPVAGTTLVIPVKYSARESLNPDFYQEFTTDKVGSSCENAGRQFLREFEEKVNL